VSDPNIEGSTREGFFNPGRVRSTAPGKFGNVVCDVTIGHDNNSLNTAPPARYIAARAAISTASRSSRPLRRRLRKTTSSKRLTSWATSCWIASAVFFLRRQGLFDRPPPADLLVDCDQLAAPLLEAAKFGDLVLGLADGGRGGQRLGDGFAGGLVGQAQVGALARIAGTGAMAPRFAAAADGTGDRAAPEVFEAGQRSEQGGPLGFHSLQRVGLRNSPGESPFCK